MENLKIDEEFKDLIPELQEEEFRQLESNLLNEGWRANERIIIWNGTIIDGHNRYAICQKNNIEFKTSEKKFKDKNEAIIWIIENQLGRRNLSTFDRLELVYKYEEIIKSQGKRTDLLPSGKKLNIHEEISNKARVGAGTKQRYDFIKNKLDKETKKKLSEGKETINKVYTILKRREKVNEIKKELIKPKPITKKYEIIYADPAWEYNRKVGEGIAEEQYRLSGLEEMKKIPVDFISEKDSVLFMWVTFPMLKEGLELMESWGFEYKTCAFNWIKLNKNGKPFFGIGYYTKSNSEICLLGIKGNGFTILDNTISQIIMTEKEVHSKKPEEVRNLIVQLFGDRKRIELFARQKVEGWDTYGDEIR
jgi:site-specific DNA-methyltransferase (adenine-specific)